MLDLQKKIKLTIEGREFLIPRPSVLHFDVSRLAMMQSMIAAHAAEALAAQKALLTTPDSDEAGIDALVDKLNSSIQLIGKTGDSFRRRVLFWLGSLEDKGLQEAVMAVADISKRELAISALFHEALLQITGGDDLAKNS